MTKRQKDKQRKEKRQKARNTKIQRPKPEFKTEMSGYFHTLAIF